MTKLQKPNLKNCVKCGKIFVPVGPERYCADCRRKQEDQEREISRYVRDHPGVSIETAAEALDAPKRLVKRMAFQGKFSAGTGKAFAHSCLNCGRTITQGTYCADCLEKLRNESKKLGALMELRSRRGERDKKTTIEKLNAKAQQEFEMENSKPKNRFSKGLRERIVGDKD